MINMKKLGVGLEAI